MSSTINIPFTIPGNYTTSDSGKIAISDDNVKLLLQQDDLDFEETFASATGFTYDSDKVEFTGGKIQQKDQRPADATFAATYTNSINGSWGNGTLTGTATGGAGLVQKFGTNCLDLSYNDTRHVGYAALDNCDMLQSGTIGLWYKPKYSGTPASDKTLFDICKAAGDTKNQIKLSHLTGTGAVYLTIKDLNGSNIVATSLGAWSPTAGTYYHIELNFDITAGATRLFIAGTQHGTTQTGTGTRDSNIGLLRIGYPGTGSGNPYSYIDEVLVYNAVKHITTFTPPTAENDHSDTSLLMAIHYNTSIDISYSKNGGALTGTATGGASIDGEKIDLSYLDGKRIDYAALGNADSQQVGAIKFKVTPNYTGAPAADRWFFCICKAHNDVKNAIMLRHSSSGPYLRLHMYDSTGAWIVEHLCGTWFPVAGTKYEFELNWDLTSGATRLFVENKATGDCEQSGSTYTGTATRDSNIGLLRIGNNHSASSVSNFKIEDLVVFSTVQHTGNYTPGYTISETVYVASKVSLPIMEHTYAGTILQGNSLTTVYGGLPRITIDVGQSGIEQYYDSGWKVSAESFDEANTPSAFDTNFPTLTVEGEKYGQFFIYFTYSNDTQGYVDNLIANMRVDIGYPTDNPYVDWNSSFKGSELTDFVETATKTGADEIKYVIKIDGNFKYYNAGLQDSDGSYPQANTAAEILANIGDFLTTRAVVAFRAFLHSDDSSTKPDLDNLSVSYNSVIADPTFPTLVNLEGFLYNGGSPASNVKIYMRPYLAGFFTGGVFQRYSWTHVSTTNSIGWFEINQYLQPSGSFWEIKFGGKRYKLALLDQEEMNLTEAETYEVIPVE